jgi:hypothetical protein
MMSHGGVGRRGVQRRGLSAGGLGLHGAGCGKQKQYLMHQFLVVNQSDGGICGTG